MSVIEKIAIDLGTRSSFCYVNSQDKFVKEPSIVVVSKSTGYIAAAGNEAKKSYDKLSKEYIQIEPFKNGSISDYDATEKLLNTLIKDSSERSKFIRPDLFLCVPEILSDVEEKALFEAAKQAGARKVYFIPQSVAVALAMGFDDTSYGAVMTVCMGAGISGVSTVMGMRTITAKAIDFAGTDIDNAIIRNLHAKYGFLVDNETAEVIKKEIGSLYPSGKEQIQVVGVDQKTDTTSRMNVTSRDVAEAVSPVVNGFVEMIKKHLCDSPPDVVADVYKNGIILAGGTAMLKGLSEFIENTLEVKVLGTTEPERLAIEGMRKYIGNRGNSKNYGILSRLKRKVG